MSQIFSLNLSFRPFLTLRGSSTLASTCSLSNMITESSFFYKTSISWPSVFRLCKTIEMWRRSRSNFQSQNQIWTPIAYCSQQNWLFQPDASPISKQHLNCETQPSSIHCNWLSSPCSVVGCPALVTFTYLQYMMFLTTQTIYFLSLSILSWQRVSVIISSYDHHTVIRRKDQTNTIFLSN